MAFLLAVRPARSRLSLATSPVSPSGRRSTSMSGVSVPPVTTANPPATRVSANARAFSSTRPAYFLEFGPQRFAEAHGFGRNGVEQGAPLQPRKHCRIEFPGQRLVVGQDQSATRAAKALVRRGRDHMGMRHRTRVDVSGDQAGEMRHVDEERGAAVVRDRAEPFEIDRARKSRPTGDDQLR